MSSARYREKEVARAYLGGGRVQEVAFHAPIHIPFLSLNKNRMCATIRMPKPPQNMLVPPPFQFPT